MMQTSPKPRVLTGLRANNALTIGNYLGAVLPMVNLIKKHKDTHDFYMFVPDLHSFTTPIDHSKLHGSVLNNVAFYVATGAISLEGEHTKAYRQSYVPAHSELAWILDCFTDMGEMGRMTQFKEKSGIKLGHNTTLPDLASLNLSSSKEALLQALEHYESFIKEGSKFRLTNKRAQESVSVGLFNYPVLMAADILLYNALYVPLGDDQTQHLEFTRDIAQRLNAKFGDLFTVPLAMPKQHEFFGRDNGLRVRDLQNPTKKMSKSDESGKGVIFLTDSPQEAAKKVMGATTDSLGKIAFDYQNQPGISNLLQLLALLTNQDQAKVNAQYAGHTSYGDLKKDVAKAVADFLTDFQQKLGAVDRQAVLAKLQKDEAFARDQANQTLYKVQQAVGLRPKN